MKQPIIARIVLLCSGLEEGRNGVGDHCRLLAKHLSARGIECCLVALNDLDVQETVEVADAAVGADPWIVRIPHRLTASQRLRVASDVLARFRPDWVSLHFVCYGFDVKGLAYREVWWLPSLLRGYRLHVMFHETWVGHGVFRTRKDTIVGGLQRLIIFILLKRLKPRVISTSNEYYMREFEGLGFPTTLLPIFGNIPIAPATAVPWIYTEIHANGGPDLAAERACYWLFGIFGGIVEQWPAKPLLAKLCRSAEQNGRRVIVAVIGKTSERIEALKTSWTQRFPSIIVLILGQRSPVEISQFFTTIDFGLTSHPIYTLGKSGGVAAMLEHGLPVIANWGDIAPDLKAVSSPLSALIWKDDELLEGRILSGHRKVQHPEMADATAKMFMDLLAKSTRPGELVDASERCSVARQS
jgi:hypothetical protein